MTDEFIAHIKAAGSAWDLDQTSQFVVVAATLLDLKAARAAYPPARCEDPGGPRTAGGTGPAVRAVAAVSRLPARGQLHRGDTRRRRTPIPSRRRDRAAFRPAAARGDDDDQPGPSGCAGREGDGAEAGQRVVAGPHARPGGQRPRAGHGGRSIGCGASGTMTFRALTSDSSTMLTTVARFLALLELFRDGAVGVRAADSAGRARPSDGPAARTEDWMISDEFDETTDAPEADE